MEINKDIIEMDHFTTIRIAGFKKRESDMIRISGKKCLNQILNIYTPEMLKKYKEDF